MGLDRLWGPGARLWDVTVGSLLLKHSATLAPPYEMILAPPPPPPGGCIPPASGAAGVGAAGGVAGVGAAGGAAAVGASSSRAGGMAAGEEEKLKEAAEQERAAGCLLHVRVESEADTDGSRILRLVKARLGRLEAVSLCARELL